MKKQFIIALSLACSFSFAQKKELKAAEKAIKGTNFAEAKAALTQAESFMSTMDAKLKDKFYYLQGQAFYANGGGSMADFDKSLESLGNVKSAYPAEIAKLKQDILTSLIDKGNKFVQNKDFSTASKYFEKSYRISSKDTIYLYAAAAYSVNEKEYDRALKLYEELKTLNYDGATPQFFAINKQTQQEESFPNKEMRDISVKTKTHIKPTEKYTKSKRPEIVKNVALILISQGKSEEALAAIDDARKEMPDDVNLVVNAANIHFKLGNTDEFKKLLQEATTMDPKNPELQYNLGVISSDAGENDKAKGYYEKAIELDPNYINAYINLSALILGKEEAIIEEMNGLGTSAADDKRYDELREQRQNLYREAVPFLTKALEIDGENISAAKTLMNIYSIIGETDKHKEMKELVAAIEASAN
ncbi:tetratricopeptide repeat protein [Seonamhaeicola marinus]|uniref:Tetratricopeptide repeat protein n=1 Tax=Seonamhaeicola marinus TaxID=1912246 RepID=A0A5D0HKB0_9FLAO|nr:tetratricopeptide repeat protein [Seonamhaeicola marinus]TYA71695.1 tetratricopeptide repeat protein [Seonamhaeicola marinus]